MNRARCCLISLGHVQLQNGNCASLRAQPVVRWRKSLTTEGKQAIDVCELFADGLATKVEVRFVREAAKHPMYLGESHELCGSEERKRTRLAAVMALWEGDAGRCMPAYLGQVLAARRMSGWRLARYEFADMLRDIFGNPFRPAAIDPAWLAWNRGTVVKLAKTIYEDRRWELMPILGDGLEDALCDNSDILEHCRGPGPHVRGCWVVDLLLGKE